METSCLHLLLSRRGKAAQGSWWAWQPALKWPLAVLCRMAFVRTGGKYLSESWHEVCPGDAYNRICFRRGAQKRAYKAAGSPTVSSRKQYPRSAWPEDPCYPRHHFTRGYYQTWAMCFQSHLEPTCGLWWPRSDWPQIHLAARVRRALTPRLFCWWQETGSQSLTLQPWPLTADQNLCPPQSHASGVLALCRWWEVAQVLLVWFCWLLLMLTLGFWPLRFSKRAVNWMWRCSLWFLQFFFFREETPALHYSRPD